jgi:hypothetical protein
MKPTNPFIFSIKRGLGSIKGRSGPPVILVGLKKGFIEKKKCFVG